MPHFYFHLDECGERTIDEEGMELPDYEAAHLTAVAAVRSIMSAEIAGGVLCLTCSIEITDERNNIVGRVWFYDAVDVRR